MIDGLKVLAVVPARGGSKGLPRKNILDLAGRPLIAWTLAAARQSRLIDRCVVSTDDEEIAAVARAHGGDVPFMRPAELSTDTAETASALIHVIEQLPGYDILVTLQPTSPLRIAEDIDQALREMQHHGAPACVSVVEPVKSPYWSYRINNDNHLEPLMQAKYSTMRRQDLPTAYVLNGAVYATRVNWLLKHQSGISDSTVPYVMPMERSIDIDAEFDLDVATLILERQKKATV